MSNKLDITSTVIEKGIDSVKSFLGKLIGPAIEEAGLLMADHIRLWRFNNQIAILQKAQKIVKDKNLDTKIIAVKTLVPFLEYSSLEEDEKLQDMWTNLFVNYVDANKKYESSVYPFILSQLSSQDVQLLKKFEVEASMSRNSLDAGDATIANLVRLGLLNFSMSNAVVKMFFSTADYASYDTFHLTPLGKEFIECCSPRE